MVAFTRIRKIPPQNLFVSNHLILAANRICHIGDGAIGAAVHDVGIALGRGDATVADRLFHRRHIFADVRAHADERVSQVVYSHMRQFGVF